MHVSDEEDVALGSVEQCAEFGRGDVAGGCQSCPCRGRVRERRVPRRSSSSCAVFRGRLRPQHLEVPAAVVVALADGAPVSVAANCRDASLARYADRLFRSSATCTPRCTRCAKQRPDRSARLRADRACRRHPRLGLAPGRASSASSARRPRASRCSSAIDGKIFGHASLREAPYAVVDRAAEFRFEFRRHAVESAGLTRRDADSHDRHVGPARPNQGVFALRPALPLGRPQRGSQVTELFAPSSSRWFNASSRCRPRRRGASPPLLGCVLHDGYSFRRMSGRHALLHTFR